MTEGAIRYRLKRRAEGRPDGRKLKTSALAAFSRVIGVWIADYEGSRRRPTLWLLDRLLPRAITAWKSQGLFQHQVFVGVDAFGLFNDKPCMLFLEGVGPSPKFGSVADSCEGAWAGWGGG